MLHNNSTNLPYYFWRHTFVDFIWVSYALRFIAFTQLMQCHYSFCCIDIVTLKWVFFFFFQIRVQSLTQKIDCNIFYSSIFPRLFLCPKFNNKWPTNPCIHFRMLFSLFALVSLTKLKIANFSHSPCKIWFNAWKSIICFTSMLKNMYDLKSNKNILFFIATVIAEIQSEKKMKTRSKLKRSE